MSNTNDKAALAAAEKEVFKEVEYLDHDGQTKAEKEIYDTAVKYARTEWAFGGEFLVRETLVLAGLMSEGDEPDEDLIITLKSKYLEHKIQAMQKTAAKKEKGHAF